mgnify:CR=1 FL=1
MKVIVFGANGRMGKVVTRMVGEGMRDSEIAALIDANGDGVNVLNNVKDFTGSADVIIDFSHFSATKTVTDFAVKKNIPLVIASTGQGPEEISVIQKASESVPIFISANMSLGVALLAEMARKVASAFPDADIEIVETHHNRKTDAPSGTALLLANAIKEVRPESVITCNRMGKREKNEIGIASVRMGNIVGIHDVMISTDNQTITLRHQAFSRDLFAEGAIAAAEFILGKKPGLYNMYDLCGEVK